MFERVPSHSPHRDLWQTILLVTVEDALLGPAQVMSQESRLRTCKAARAYLTTPSADLAQVCTLAGFDMRAVIERMQAKIAKAPTAEALTSKRRLLAATLYEPAPPPAKPTRFADREFTIQGATRTAAEWCARFDIPLALAQSRICRHWLPERAFTMTKKEAQREALEKARQACRRTVRPAQARTLRAPSASTPRYTHAGESLTLAQWAERAGLKKGTLAKRLRCGMTLSEALAPCLPIERRPMGDLVRDIGSTRVHQQPSHGIVTLRHTHPLAAGEAEDALIISRRCDADNLGDCDRDRIAGAVAAQQVQFDEAHDGSPLRSEAEAQPRPQKEGPGVVVNLRHLAGTGGGRSAHDLPEISFSPCSELQSVKSEIPA